MISEAHRIAALPHASINVDESLIDALTDELSTPSNRVKKNFRLKPLQVKSLLHARAAGGLLGLLGCGVGKTLLSALLPTYLKVERPLLLVPAALVEKTKLEFAEWSKYFQVHSAISVISYERVSRASGQKELKELAPDLIICDEAHNLKELSSARTLRVGTYLEANEGCRAIFLSGTLLNKSITNIAHLADWALSDSSPFPREMRTVAEWDALVYGESNTFIESRFAPIQKLAPQGSARDAVFTRLSTCAGVVLTDKDTVEASLQITKVFCDVPKELTQKIQKCFDEGVVAAFDGVENIEALVASEHLWSNADDFALRALAQMYSGFLYYWEWENNVADEVWLAARRQWKGVARKILEMNVEGFDTLGLIENNFNELPADIIRVAESAYHAWFSSGEYQKDEPPKACVWVSDYLIESVGKLLKKIGQPTLIWVNFTALAERMASLLGLTYVGGGEEIPEYTGQSLILSIKSHGTGKNLQAWSNNIVAAPINDPAMWEQLLARTHRTGQSADTVNVYTFQHAIFGASFNRARYMSKAVGDCTGNTRRINYADIVSEKLG